MVENPKLIERPRGQPRRRIGHPPGARIGRPSAEQVLNVVNSRAAGLYLRRDFRARFRKYRPISCPHRWCYYIVYLNPLDGCIANEKYFHAA